MSAPRIGDLAPDFELKAADGRVVKLSEFRGKKSVVLFFYPKDDTPGCTIEACTFRDRYEEFAAAGAEVIGVSADDAASHERFASRHKLPMTLLSDTNGDVRAKYGVSALLGILPGRVTFVIDREGKLRHTFSARLQFKKHVQESLDALRA